MNRCSRVGVPIALMLTGCSGSLFQSKEPPVTIYRLSPAMPPAASAAAASPAATTPSGPANPAAADAYPGAAAALAEVAVLKPRVRAGLEGERIAVLYPDQRLDYFAAARWSGPLPDVLQDAVVETLRARAHLRGVSADASAFASAYWLELEVSDFEAVYPAGGGAPAAHVRLTGRIGGSADRRVIMRLESDVVEPASANRLGAIVESLARAAGRAFAQVASQTDAALAGAPP